MCKRASAHTSFWCAPPFLFSRRAHTCVSHIVCATTINAHTHYRHQKYAKGVAAHSHHSIYFQREIWAILSSLSLSAYKCAAWEFYHLKTCVAHRVLYSLNQTNTLNINLVSLWCATHSRRSRHLFHLAGTWDPMCFAPLEICCTGVGNPGRLLWQFL